MITAQRLGKQLPTVLELWHNLVGTAIGLFAQVRAFTEVRTVLILEFWWWFFGGVFFQLLKSHFTCHSLDFTVANFKPSNNFGPFLHIWTNNS